MEPTISVRQLEKSFDGLAVLRGVDLEVRRSELTVLIGPSGCGKSTLLRCLNGLETPERGRVRIAGIDLNYSDTDSRHHEALVEEARHLRAIVGMVFQSFNLFPHLTALQNVTLAPIVVKREAPAEVERRATELLEKVGLGTHLGHYPHQLSGGQQQRAAIARALAMNPEVLLYDEPTSALDPGLVDEVLQVMKKLDEEGMTQVVVTHEMRFAKDAADQVLFLDDGKVVERGAAEEIFTKPRDERTREFLKKYL